MRRQWRLIAVLPHLPVPARHHAGLIIFAQDLQAFYVGAIDPSGDVEWKEVATVVAP
jgi:hypothetical protein